MTYFENILQHHTGQTRLKSLRGTFSTAAALACITLVSVNLAYAQANGLGSYKGTINISGTEITPKVSYSASIEINLPITESDDDSITAEFFSGEAPDAKVTITQWDESHTETSLGIDGKYASYTCKPAAPKDIPMTPTGILEVDLENSVHLLSLTLLGTVEIDLDCVHSQSGAHKRKKGVALYSGTGVPGMHYEHPIAFTDSAHLTANYTLVTNPDESNLGPIVQEWDLRRTD